MKLEDEIDNLVKLLLKMADLVETNLKEAFLLYRNYDVNKKELINDDIVDLHERLIEETCLSIMLKERPYAKDLREITGILTLVSDLERLGDHAEDMANLATKLQKCEVHKIDSLDKMIDTAMDMVHKSILSFVNKDKALAQEVINTDDIVDDLFNVMLDYLIDEKKENGLSQTFAIYTTLVVKYIERIADHAVNVAEWVIYMLSGYYKDKQIF